ncbi:MAG: AzlD domain-containing protein [Sphaerochaetaceae bacterium]|nr:AzlD domain-containing protein [Sphaerochaetaceae bacterium]
MTRVEAAITVAIISIVTIVLRFIPFWVFGRGDKKTPPFINYLGRVLPYAAMGMLVIYCYKDITFESLSSYLPYLISGIVTVITQVITRKTTYSIVSGTLCAIVLLNFVF